MTLEEPAPRTTDTPSTSHAIWATGLVLVAGTTLLLALYPFPGNEEALLDLRKFKDGTLGLVSWLAALAMMSIGWIGGMRAARGRTASELWLPVTVLTAATYLLFLFVYPGTAIDVYIYAARSHLLTDYGLNPSTALPQALWDIDPYVRYASSEWSERPSPYGPLWNLIAAPATAFDSERIGTAVLMLKAIMVLAAVATGVLVHDIAKRVQPRLALSAMLGWLWSPVVLWEGIANGHNDVLLAMLLVAAFWCWYRGHLGGVLPLLGAAALLKVVAVLIIPAAIVAIVRRTGWNQRLVRIALQTGTLSIAVLGIAFMPFFDIGGTIEAIRTQSNVMVTSPALLTQAISNEMGWGIDVRGEFPRFSMPVIVLLTLGGALLAWRRPSHLPLVAFEQLFWFLLLATSNLRPWYAIWLVALAVVLPLGMPLARAVAWAIGALGTYAYLLWVQHWYDAEWIVEVAITVGIMLLPVLLVTAWATLRPPSASSAQLETNPGGQATHP